MSIMKKPPVSTTHTPSKNTTYVESISCHSRATVGPSNGNRLGRPYNALPLACETAFSTVHKFFWAQIQVTLQNKATRVPDTFVQWLNLLEDGNCHHVSGISKTIGGRAEKSKIYGNCLI